MEAAEVLSTHRLWSCEQADCLEWMTCLPSDSVDLVFSSPPYEQARSYGIDFALEGQAWVNWMVRVYLASLRICRGLVVFVVEGRTKNFQWSAVPALLMADLHRAGICLRKPPIYHRMGIPGSGGPDWLRNDYEFIVCATRGGRMSWSDNTACGRPTKWKFGVAPSYRLTDGTRANEPSDKCGYGNNIAGRNADGSKKLITNHIRRRSPSGYAAGNITNREFYSVPVLVNPGNVISCMVGGGKMGSKLAHENDAPFPEQLAEFFIRSFSQPGGVVADCFAGSGTTLSVSVREGRRAIGCDIRKSQVKLTARRMASVTPALPFLEFFA